MIKLLRLLCGYVAFEASGGFCERFLNLCKINNLNLWNIKNDGVKVIAFTTASEFALIKKPAQNAGMEINVVKECGLPFFIKRHKWRCGAVFGIFMVFVAVWFLSGFIWEVEIVNDNDVKIEGFTEYLADLGVETGARKSKVDILQVQENLLDTFSELSWVSINIFGTKAQVEYMYAKPQKKIADNKSPTNVVSSKTGEIVLVEGYVGENVVKIGDCVAEGSLLISGVIKNADLSENLVHARGKVFAKTENEIISISEEDLDCFLTNEINSIYKLVFFGLKIPFGKIPEEENITTTGEFMFQGNHVVLPVGMERTDCLLLKVDNIQLKEDRCKKNSLLNCVEEKRERFFDSELQSVQYKTEKIGESLKVSAKIICVENIAVEVPFQKEEN